MCELQELKRSSSTKKKTTKKEEKRKKRRKRRESTTKHITQKVQKKAKFYDDHSVIKGALGDTTEDAVK